MGYQFPSIDPSFLLVLYLRLRDYLFTYCNSKELKRESLIRADLAILGY